MSAYIIVSYDVAEPEAYQEYVQKVGDILAKHGGELLVAEFEPECREGEGRGAYVVLRFESVDAARGWYDDPAYDPVRQIRLDSTKNGSLVIVREFTPPGG